MMITEFQQIWQRLHAKFPHPPVGSFSHLQAQTGEGGLPCVLRFRIFSSPPAQEVAREA